MDPVIANIRKMQQPKRKAVKNDATKVQRLRFWAQVFALGVNIWIGAQFYLWLQHVRTGGGMVVSRPPGVEGWLPIGSLVSLRYWLQSGIINDIHPAGMFILIAVLLTAFLFKKGFCSWVCPVGFVSEILGDISDKLWSRRIKPPRWLDYPLRSLKYLLLAFFLWAVLWSMTPASIKSFVYSDYNLVTDVLMLRFFTHASLLSVIVISALFLLSLVVRGFWCRYLCPYGALLGLIGLVSPTRIRRNATSCIDCAACAKACPAFIKVDKVKQVNSDECTGCLACVDACPVKNTLEVKAARRTWTVSPVRWAALLLIVFWGGLLAVKTFGPWQNDVSDEQYKPHIERAYRGEYVHP